MTFHGAHIAAAAAAKRRRQRIQEEEERMTKYSPADLEDGWEFKIVRAETPVFRKPEVFQQLLQEEAAAGWQMVEKLDDMRVRFKRSPAARKRDAMLAPGIDPYRTRYGGSTRTAALLIFLLIMAAGLVIGLAPLVFPAMVQEVIIAVIVVMFLLILILVLLRFRR